ncbi:MAG: hypothetical protein ACRD29_02365 [Acidimicrobiales bacterium]
MSMSQVVQDAIDESVPNPDKQELMRRALEVAGKYRSGLSDVSVNHDHYLAEAYYDWHEK